MSDLAERLKGVIEEKLAIARAATPGPWTPYGKVLAATFNGCNCAGGQGWLPHEPYCGDEPISADMRETDVAFIAAHDPAWAIRQHEAALRVLSIHRRMQFGGSDARRFGNEFWCRNCRNVSGPTWPCPSMALLADAYGVPVDTEEENRG